MQLLNDLIISNGITKNVFGTVCGDEVRVKEMKKRRRNEENFKRQTGKQY